MHRDLIVRLRIRSYSAVGFRDLSMTPMLWRTLDIRIRHLMGCRSVKWAMLDMEAESIFAAAAVVVYYYGCIDSGRVTWCDWLGLLRMVVEVKELFRLRETRPDMARNS